MQRHIKKLPALFQFLVLFLFLLSLTIAQALLNETRLPQLLDPDQDGNSAQANQVQTISLACLFSEELKPNQTLETLLSAKGLPRELIGLLSEPLKKIVNLKQLKPGELFSLWSSPDSEFVLLEYEKSPTEIYQVAKNATTVDAYPVPVYLDKRIATASSVIQNSLWESLQDKVNSPELIVKLTDIFAWEIDFLTETRPGDKLKFIYEEIYKGDEFVGYGDILAAEVQMSDLAYRAFLFQDPLGHCGYYDDGGKSLRKAFLKSPLNFKRISSGFSYSRRHPILHNTRPHYGVDFAAPAGTPVAATSDGIVKYVGWKGGLGRYVEIRHSNGWITGYGHLSRFAAGISAGKRISQQDVIGYVGTTGWTTGPHLHYQVEISGRFVNPLRMQVPAGSSVRPEYLAEFQKARDKFLVDLSATPLYFVVGQN